MMKATELIIDTGFSDRVFNHLLLKQLFTGSEKSRYAIINKIMHKGELVRLRRGLYVIGEKYRPKKLSHFYLANQIIPCSYISLETALAHHGWIPEHVTDIHSMTAKQPKKTVLNEFGEFNYLPIHTQPYEFLTGVTRENIDNQPFLIATPLRALLDLILTRRIKKSALRNLNYLTSNLRIEWEDISQITEEEIQQIRVVFTSKKVAYFLDQLSKALRK